MKTNVALHNKIGFQDAAQKAWYTAHVLASALTNSPAINIRAATPAISAKAEVIAQTAKPARAASLPVAASANTTGYGFGELYLNSPAYPAGTAIPAIPAKPASAAVIGKPAVVGAAAVTAISSPAVVAVKGWEDAIDIKIIQTGSVVDRLEITAILPVYAGGGIQGSTETVVAEITPATLQATEYVDPGGVAYASGQDSSVIDNPKDLTLEQVFYRMAQLCDRTIEDVVKIVNGVNVKCKKIVVTLYPSSDFRTDTTSLQLTEVRLTAGSGS